MNEAILNILEDEGDIKHEIRDAAQFRDLIYDTVVANELALKKLKHKTIVRAVSLTIAQIGTKV